VVSGRGRFLAGRHLECTLAVVTGDFIYVPPNAPHAVVNDGQEDLVLVVARNTQEERVAEYDPEAGAVVTNEARRAPLGHPLLLNRCKTCRVPIRGPLALVSRLRGVVPYGKNPQLCSRCESRIKGVEEKVVTALFADLRGSTAMSVERSSTELLGVLRRFFDRATAAVYDNFGVVNEFLGDGMLVFFNAPVPRDTHPEDALRSALAIQESLQTAPFGVGIGIETGVAMVGDPGVGGFVDFTCLGEPVNVASRLQGVARAGEVVVGPNAWRNVSELVEMRGIPWQAEVTDLRGVGPVNVYRLSPLAGAPSLSGSAGPHPVAPL
jgi:class 3 adenylate cyclase